MASGSFSLNRTGSTSSHCYATINWSSSSNGSQANSSNVSVEIVLWKDNKSTAKTSGRADISVTVEGSTQTASKQFSVNPNSSISLWSGSWVVGHNSDGTKSTTISVTIGGNVIWFNGSSTAVLDTIPRYFSQTPSLWVASKTETSITYGWSTSETCNWVRYYLDGSSSWVDVFSGSATSGSFTISGYGEHTSHNVIAECRRADSGIWSNTEYYPHCTSSPDFTIGNAVTLSFHNPLSRSINVDILSSSDQVLATGSTTGTSLTGFNSLAQITNYYSSIPNAQSGTYKVRVTYGSVTKTRSNSNKYSIRGTEKPVVSGITSQYTANLTDLTNNNQAVINGVSTITFRITNGATAQNSASISKYNVKWGNVSADITNISNSATLTGGTGNTITITAYDSRGLNNSTTKTISELINYVNPTASASTRRNNGIEKNTYMTIAGKIFYNKFGTSGITNAVKEIRYWVNTSQSWSGNGYALDLTNIQYLNPSGNLQDYILRDIAIHANGSSGGFVVGTRYYIKVRVTDADGKISDSYVETITSVTDGKIAEDFYQDDNGNYHQGVNGLANANYTSDIHGNLNVDDAIYLNGTKLLWYE